MLDKLLDFYNNIKYFIQRGRRGYSDRDVWSMDYYLLEIIPPMLADLRRIKHGYPSKLSDKKWTRYLTLMEEGFRSGHKLVELEYDINDKRQAKALKSKFTHGFKLFQQYFFDLWD